MIPVNYKWDNFVRFSLNFDPLDEFNDWSENDHIPQARFPMRSDSIIGIRGYLYNLQRINNPYFSDESDLKLRVESTYEILRQKLK